MSQQPQSNRSFVKVNTQFMLSPTFSGLSDNAKVVYFALRKYSDGNYKPCYPSQARLAEDTGKSTKTIERGVKELAVAKIITVQKNRTGSNFYYFVAERNTEHPTNLSKAPDKSVGSVPMTNKSTESPLSLSSKQIQVGKLPDKHPTNLSAKQELSFKQQTRTKGVSVSMQELPITQALRAVKKISPADKSEQAFTSEYHRSLATLIKDYSLERWPDVEKELGGKGKDYEKRLISFARLLTHAYNQESLNAPHAWALSEFRKNPQADIEHVTDPRFYIEPAELIYQRFYDNIKIDTVLKRKQAEDALAKEKAVQNRMATAQSAPLELQQEAQKRFPLYSDATLFDVRRAQVLREEWICEQLKQKQGVA